MTVGRQVSAGSFVETGAASTLLELSVFRLGLLQDGEVGVGVFPEGEEVLVSGAGLGEGIGSWHGHPKL